MVSRASRTPSRASLVLLLLLDTGCPPAARDVPRAPVQAAPAVPAAQDAGDDDDADPGYPLASEIREFTCGDAADGLSYSYPLFHHPDARVAAAIEAATHMEVEARGLARECDRNVTWGCFTTFTNARLMSIACVYMRAPTEGGGGAPVRETYNATIDDGKVTPFTLGDVVRAQVDRDRITAECKRTWDPEPQSRGTCDHLFTSANPFAIESDKIDIYVEANYPVQETPFESLSRVTLSGPLIARMGSGRNGFSPAEDEEATETPSAPKSAR